MVIVRVASTVIKTSPRTNGATSKSAKAIRMMAVAARRIE
jgi:hypothetical protein